MGIQDNRIPKFGEQAFCPYLLTMAHFNRLISSTSLLEGRLREALENPSSPRENTRVIARTYWAHGQQAARIQ